MFVFINTEFKNPPRKSRLYRYARLPLCVATKDTTVSPINNDADEARKGHIELGYTSSAVAKHGTIYVVKS